MARCGAVLIVVAVALAVLVAAMPWLMSALLRHMFTAPGQETWRSGKLRLINISGMPAQALNSAERARELSGSDSKFRHKNGDVWVASYVKSGTTWTIGILAALFGHEAAQYAGHLQKTTRNFCPQPELPDLGWGDDGFGHSIEELNAWPSPRCFKTHWPSKDHVASNGKSKFIYVMRNAQDQMTSHWNQVWGMGFHYGTENMTFHGGWDGFVDDWLNGDVENGQWFDHVASWYIRRNDPDVLFLRFEDLKADPHAVIGRIADFVAITDKNIDDVVDITSFANMRKADENDMGLKFMRWLGVLRKKHIRQGNVGSGASRFNSAQLAAMEVMYNKKLKPLGMPRDWVFLE